MWTFPRSARPRAGAIPTGALVLGTTLLAAACSALSPTPAPQPEDPRRSQERQALAAGTEHAVDSPVLPVPIRSQASPVVARGATQHLAVWKDTSTPGGPSILAVRIADDGTVVAPVLTVADGGNTEPVSEESRLAVAYTGGTFLAVWSYDISRQTYGVYGRRIADDGTLSAAANLTAGIPGGTHTAPALAGDGTHFLLAWERDSGSGADILGLRVEAATGMVVPGDASGVSLVARTGNQSEPTLAHGDQGFLLAWREGLGGNQTSVRATRVNAAMPGAVTVDDDQGLELSPETTPRQGLPFAAAATGRFFVAWEQKRSVGQATATDIVGIRVAPAADGGMGFQLEDATPVVLSNTAREQETPAVVTVGDAFLVAWSRAGSILLGYDIVGARVRAATGLLVDAEPFNLSAEIGDEFAPHLAGGPSLPGLLAYSRRDATGTTFGVWGRALIPDLAEGATCQAGHQCASGFCVDQVCCNEACGGGDPNDCMACAGRANGTDGQCGAVPAGTVVCRSRGLNLCDQSESCDGTSRDCPDDHVEPDLTPCGNGLLCLGGYCGGPPVPDAGGDGSPSEGGAGDGGDLDGALADGGLADASQTDGSLDEGGLADSGLTDASLADGSPDDSGLTDASLADGSLADSGLTDASLADGSLADGSLADSGLGDGSSADGAGTTTGGGTSAGGTTSGVREDAAGGGTTGGNVIVFDDGGDGLAPPEDRDVGISPGCGCRTAGAPSSPSPWALVASLVVAAGALGARRRQAAKGSAAVLLRER